MKSPLQENPQYRESVPGNVTVVIRSAGERTEAACRAAILQQGVEPSQVVVVREAPFSQAMRVGYQAGVDAGRPWTFCIDADVILRPGAIAAMLSHAQRQRSDVFEIQGFVLDKLFISLREAGNHLFRTGLLPELIASIPEEGRDLRPESYAMQQMVKKGYRWANVPYVVGLHDFEQSNRDIFRKSFTHAQKHLRLMPALFPKFRDRAAEDPDFSIMIEGIAEGLRAREAVRIDIRHQPFDRRFDALGIREKDPLGADELTPDHVEKLLRQWAKAPDLTVRALPVSGPEAVELDGRTTYGSVSRLRAIWRRKRGEVGFGKLLLLTLAQGLDGAARKLRAMAGAAK